MGGFCPGDFVLGGFCPGDFVRGVVRGDFVLEPLQHSRKSLNQRNAAILRGINLGDHRV